MQTRLNVVAALVLAAGFAGQAFADTDQLTVEPFVGSKTRAEVRAELAAANTRVDVWKEGYTASEPFRSTASRADLAADYIAARDEVRAMTSEVSGVGPLAALPATRADAIRTVAGHPVNAQ